MTDLPPIVVMDTCILLELLDVPKHNERHSDITEEFQRLEDIGADLILPMAAIIEAGNHIADLPNGHDRRVAAMSQPFARRYKDKRPGKRPNSPTIKPSWHGWTTFPTTLRAAPALATPPSSKNGSDYAKNVP